MPNFLWPCGLQHTMLPCPSSSPRVCSNSCPLSQWCYLIISSSVALLFFCRQSFPSSGSFPTSWLFTSGGQNIGASASSVLLINIQGWFPLGLIDLISLQSKGFSRGFSSHHNSKASVLWCSAFFTKECSNYRTIALISHASKVMLKILQAQRNKGKQQNGKD